MQINDIPVVIKRQEWDDRTDEEYVADMVKEWDEEYIAQQKMENAPF